LEILTNTGSAPINNTFNGLDEGAVFTQGGYQFQITYQGGTGGDTCCECGERLPNGVPVPRTYGRNRFPCLLVRW
jgi:hypothetical protein